MGLLEVIEEMKHEFNQERSVFESIAVRQDILLRRKDEYESAKLIVSQVDK